MLRIEMAKNIGFCFGVERAVKTVESLLSTEKDVYVTGDLIHNEEEMVRLEKMGLKSFNVNEKWPNLSNSTVVIRAHGIPVQILKLLEKNAKRVVDATCPVVSGVAHLLQHERKNGFEVFLYGREGHAEVEYLKSTVDRLKVLNWQNSKIFFSTGKIALFSQTTMDIDGFKKMAKAFLNSMDSFSTFHIHNTICSVTTEREEEVKSLSKTSDLCLIIGGRKSSNTKKLYEIAKRLNENAHMILNASEIQKNWFNSVKSVGICSGTSTPSRTIENIVERLRNFKN